MSAVDGSKNISSSPDSLTCNVAHLIPSLTQSPSPNKVKSPPGQIVTGVCVTCRPHDGVTWLHLATLTLLPPHSGCTSVRQPRESISA